jgi:hypothetical protein
MKGFFITGNNKKVKQAIIWFHLLIFLFFANSLYLAGFDTSENSLFETNPVKQESSFNTSTSDLFCPIAKTENTLRESSALHLLNLKNSDNKFFARFDVTQVVIFTSFTAYYFYSFYKADRFQNTDIIYPFHYFW